MNFLDKLFGRNNNSELEKKTSIIYSPFSGKVVKLENVPDPAFSTGALGYGIAIEPDGNTVYSPAKGKIITVFPTGHAIGIELDNGAELLIHIGLDTVNLDGKGFNTAVKVGDKVDLGQKLLSFNDELIKQEGYTTLTPIVVTNSINYNCELLVKSDRVSLETPLYQIN